MARESKPTSTQNFSAFFDPKVKIYLFLNVGIMLSASVVGLLLIPIWLIVGPYWAKRYYESMEARVEGRNFQYRHGVWFRQETSVPLEKIQDLSLLHGPLLDSLGLATLRVDTAGSAHPGSASASLVGVIGAETFRNAVLQARDEGERQLASKGAVVPGNELEELQKIRATLERIERLLENGQMKQAINEQS